MAKKKKNKSAANITPQAAAETMTGAKAPGSPSGGRGLMVVTAIALALALGLAGFAMWHRRKDPVRQWGRMVETEHANRIERRLQQCFGGADGDAIRRIVNEVRHGQWPTPYRQCTGTRYIEVIASPLDFLSTIGNPPPAVGDRQDRERGRLERLRRSFQALERATAGLDRSQPVPEDARDRVATALEDVAIEVNNERQSFEMLVTEAESQASWW